MSSDNELHLAVVDARTKVARLRAAWLQARTEKGLKLLCDARDAEWLAERAYATEKGTCAWCGEPAQGGLHRKCEETHDETERDDVAMEESEMRQAARRAPGYRPDPWDVGGLLS